MHLPPEARELDLGMSNFDHTIDDGFEEALRAEPNAVFGRHAGWNFNAKVWFDGERFRSEVWRYGSISDYMDSTSLSNLMHEHSDKWGSE